MKQKILDVSDRVAGSIGRYPVWMKIVVELVVFGTGGWLFVWSSPRSSYTVFSMLGLFLQLLVVTMAYQLILPRLNSAFTTLVAIMSMLFVVAPIDEYYELLYKDYELEHYGVNSSGCAFREKLGKQLATKSGRYVYYCYFSGGRRLEDVIETDVYRKDDTLKIQYSSRDPEIHRLIP